MEHIARDIKAGIFPRKSEPPVDAVGEIERRESIIRVLNEELRRAHQYRIDATKMAVTATIERCAEVADEYAKRYDLDECLEVAAAIRELKDK